MRPAIFPLTILGLAVPSSAQTKPFRQKHPGLGSAFACARTLLAWTGSPLFSPKGQIDYMRTRSKE
ncbi:exported hypothetical protein [Agrobacterium fabacearum S56]|nr:exported hypothetical protein [Agrobacterium fabacearum S56]